jgi:hypothetical protein
VTADPAGNHPDRVALHRSLAPSTRRLDWASLLKRVFATDVLVCDTCGGAMRILAILPEDDASRSTLEHLGRS